MPPQSQNNAQQRRPQNYSGHQQQNRNNQLVTRKTTQRMQNINEEQSEDAHETAEETIDPESTCYIREMMKDWQNTTNFFFNQSTSQLKKLPTLIRPEEENFG